MSYESNKQWPPRRRRERAETPNLLVQVGRALAALWRMAVGRSQSRFDSDRLRTDFDGIERLLNSNDSIHSAQAIVRADSFLDAIMKQAGGEGASFADRLRSLELRFDRTLYQSVWNAHKLRNDLAHNHSQSVSTQQAQIAIQAFRRAASALGAF